jgi:hypothetical protein
MGMQSSTTILASTVIALALTAACGDDDSSNTDPCDPLGTLRIEYLARRDSGELLLVLHPQADALEVELVRLFYGPEERVVERRIEAFERQRDGGTTHIFLQLDGADADAFFPVEFDGTAFMDGPPTLTVDGETFDLVLIASPIGGDADAAQALDQAELECLRQEPTPSEGGDGPRAYAPRFSGT